MKYLIFIFLTFIYSNSVIAKEQIIETSDGVKLFVNVKGEGPACLYLHGGPGSGSHWMEVFMGDVLEKDFTMIYLDQRGVGRSTSPADGNYSLKRMILDFEEVREALGISNWYTLGHSFGGILQMGYVEAKPASVNGMLMINCTLSMNDSFGKSWLPKAIELAGKDTPPVCYDSKLPVFERMKAIMPILGGKGILWKLFFNNEGDSRKLNETYGDFTSWNGDLSDNILDYPEYWTDFSKLSATIKVPVLFYYGRTDWAIGPEHYKQAVFPNVIFWGSDSGHMPFIETKPDLVKAIESFLGKYVRK